MEFVFSKAPEKYAGRYQLELKQSMFYRKIRLLAESEIRKEPKIPNIQLGYELGINTLEFRRAVIKAAEISEYITLGYNREDGTMNFTATAFDDKDFPFEATKQVYQFRALRETSDNSAKSLFSLDYLTEIVKKMPLTQFRLHLGQDYPCKIFFTIGRTGQIEYAQAPRVQDD